MTFTTAFLVSLAGNIAFFFLIKGIETARSQIQSKSLLSSSFALFAALIMWLVLSPAALLLANKYPWMSWFSLLPSITMVFFCARAVINYNRVGIRNVDRAIRTGLGYSQSLKLCKNQLAFLGTGASKLTGCEHFKETIQNCRQDHPVRFLLLKPDDESLTTAAARAGKSRDEYSKTVRDSLRRLSSLKRARELNVEVRFYTFKPVFRMMFIDGKLCLLSYNVYGEGDGSQLPQLHVAKSESKDTESFYHPLELFFDTLWESSEAWDFREYLSDD